MKIILEAALSLAIVAAGTAFGFESEPLDKSPGSPEINFIGHGTLMFRFEGKVIHADPWSQLADYAQLPKADLVLVTHDHRDHLDLQAIESVRKDSTVIVAPETAAKQIKGAVVMKNGDAKTFLGIPVEAVPAYNLVHMRSPGVPYHPKGQGNGYVITFASKRVYIAGDTENTPEMKGLQDIFAAFLPMNLPFTMTPEMVADAARAFRPKILYPYHFGDTDVQKLAALLKNEKGIEIRIRKMQ
jgi:L-ascorbate metabolism protein UlaG (beta-lactamase superfamily)